MTKEDITKFLSTQSLCKDFLKREIEQIASVCRIQCFLAKELIFVEGDNSDFVNYFYIVVHGDVQISKSYSFNGTEKSLMLNILTAGDCFGEIALLTQSRMRTATVKCLTNTKLLIIDKRDFLEILHTNIKLSNNLLLIFIDHLKHSNNVTRFAMFSVKDASSRLMYMLDFLRMKYGFHDGENSYTINLPFSSSKITEFLGMKQQLFSRCRLNLKAKGLLTGSGKILTIPDYKRFCNVLYGE